MASALHRPARWLGALLFSLSLLLLSTLIVSAQGDATPLAVGENRVGEITVASSTAAFSIQVGAPQTVTLQVLAITPGFLPTFLIVDPSGIVIMNAVNDGMQSSLAVTPNLADGGSYHITVSGANGSTGQFLISVQAGAPLAPPQPLTPGQALDGTVNGQTTRQAYSFSGSLNDVLLLTVRSSIPNDDPTVALRDADSGDLLALSSARLAGIRYRIGAGAGNYLLEVTHNGVAPQQAFSVCLELENGTTPCAGSSASAVATPTAALITVATATPLVTPTFSLPVIDPNGACMVASASGVTINVRSGPSTGYSVVTHLSPTMTAPVYGRLPDNTWVQVNVNGVIGWVSTTVVTLGGNCGGVPIVIPPTQPPPPTNAPSATVSATTLPFDTPTATYTPTATNTSSSGGGFPPINLSLIAPIGTLIIQPQQPTHLDYSANPLYGEANLSAGFSPDPYSVGMTAGGSVNVSYLGGSCSGFASVAPNLRVNFGGGSSLLRIYYVGANGDATMIVNDPYGNFYCVDDSFGTVNPTIDFNNPAGGSYDVWIGSYAANTNVSGTLYITGNSGNHP